MLDYKNLLPTSDKLIRSVLRLHLNQKHQNHTHTRIIEEFDLKHGEARIDMAVINGSMHGYELKSDNDTLLRLPAQIKVYNSVLDKVTLVVGKRHLYEALYLVPEWWGITIAKINDQSKLNLFELREPKNNPQADKFAVVKLLWRMEALNLLHDVGLAKEYKNKTRIEIYKQLVLSFDENTLKDRVRYCLINRKGWRADMELV